MFERLLKLGRAVFKSIGGGVQNFVYLDVALRVFFSFILFVLKWGVPFLAVIATIFMASSLLLSLIPKSLLENNFLASLITGVVSFATLKLIEGYVYILNIKKKHLKRIVLTLAELNKIHATLDRSRQIVDAKIGKLKYFKDNVASAHKGKKIEFFGSLLVDPIETFINVSEESKLEVLNVDLINSIESLILRIESNNRNMLVLNQRDVAVKNKIDQFLESLRGGDIKDWNYSQLELELEGLVGNLVFCREELGRTRNALISLNTKLAISEKEDRISFDIWFITLYTSDFNRVYGPEVMREELTQRVGQGFGLTTVEIEEVLKKDA